MCAIFGFISQRGRGPRLETIEAMVEANELRGPHAFGFAWIDARGILRQYKQTGRLSDHLPILAMLEDARMMIGHLRYATHGSPADQINNHPHPVDGGWLVHNGIVRNDNELIEDYELMRVSECDSEVIGLLIESGKGDLIARTKKAINMTQGPLAIMSLWSRPGKMITARRGNPLHYSSTSDGLYMATLPDALPGGARCMLNDAAIEFSIKGAGKRGKIESNAVELRASRQSDLFTAGRVYRGG